MAVQNVGTLYQVGLNKAVFMGWKEELEVLDTLFNKQTSKRAYEEWTGVVGPGAAEEKAKGADMVYKNLIVEAPKRILMVTYAVGIRAAMEDMQDDQYSVLTRLAEAVGRSHKVTREVQRSNIFNGAFSTSWNFRTGYDGLPLCSTSHTLSADAAYPATLNSSTTTGPSRSSTTWSNRLNPDADLDYTSFIDMVTLLRRTVSREGDFINIAPKYLVVPPELEPTAYEITRSTDRPDTASRATSSVNRFGVQIVSSPYLLDPDAWWLGGAKHDLQWFDRMPFTSKSRDAEGNWDVIVESVQRLGLGFHDPRGWAGTSGL